jgi:hypothetical protein
MSKIITKYPVEMAAYMKIIQSLYLFFAGLPLILTMFSGFMALSLLNVGFVTLFACQIIIVPICVMLLHVITDLIFPLQKNSDLLHLVPSEIHTKDINITPSYWMSHVVFFFSYVFVNAYTIYNDTSSQVADNDAKKEHRKIRTFAIMIASALILFLFICIRYMFMGEKVETLIGIIVALAAFAPLAYYAHHVAMLLGAQNGDMLGIMHQVMASIKTGNPTLCM